MKQNRLLVLCTNRDRSEANYNSALFQTVQSQNPRCCENQIANSHVKHFVLQAVLTCRWSLHGPISTELPQKVQSQNQNCPGQHTIVKKTYV